jgi:hypothetical protein
VVPARATIHTRVQVTSDATHDTRRVERRKARTDEINVGEECHGHEQVGRPIHGRSKACAPRDREGTCEECCATRGKTLKEWRVRTTNRWPGRARRRDRSQS